MERTLVILKPDCFNKRKAGAVLTRFEEAGFNIAACKMAALDRAVLDIHYAHIQELPVYPKLMEFMMSRPVLILILEGGNVIRRARHLAGPTDSNQAPAGTIRGDWGTDSMMNFIHASDSPESAEVEIQRFFKKDEIPPV